MASNGTSFQRLALLASDTARAQEAHDALLSQSDWVPLDEADAVVVLGGDGFMLQTLHAMLDAGRVVPAFGMNLGTVGFLMNRYDRRAAIATRVNKARHWTISPLRVEAVTQDGETHVMIATPPSRHKPQPIRNAERIVHPDAGHGAPFQYPDRVLKHAVPFPDAG